MAIRVLPAQLAARIAAGEVVDRPGSVAKELVENALDARSESIEVRIENGGTHLVSVRDDGEGMNEEDLRLCTLRHATSKLGHVGDLDRIATLGFRGEALTSIAAVAQLRIVTCSREKDGPALQLDVGPGHEATVLPAARGPGTTVEVRDLFSTTPARAKFLGSPRTESFHVARAVHRLALASPRVGWTLHHGARQMLRAPRVATPAERIAQIYGHDVVQKLIPIDLQRGEVSVTGYAGPPELHRGHRRDIVFIVNGRPIHDRGLSFVVGNAYRGMLRRGSYPMTVLYLELPPDAVDVNVHPRKDEVRFREARRIQETVSAALQQALASQVAVPHIALPQDPGRSTAHAGAAVREPVGLDLRGYGKASREQDAREALGATRLHRALGQLRNTYLLVEGPEGLEIVDQHVAHEQVLHAALAAQFAAGEMPRQRFLLPVRVELPFDSAEQLSAAAEELARLGVVLEDFGGGTFLLREYPAPLAEHQARRGFQVAIEELVDTLGRGIDAKAALHHRLLSSLACSAAIVAGTPMSVVEQQALVDRLMCLDDPYRCPHGRPIVVKLDEEELKRRFGRR